MYESNDEGTVMVPPIIAEGPDLHTGYESPSAHQKSSVSAQAASAVVLSK